MNRTNTIHGYVRVNNGALSKAILTTTTILTEVHTIAGSRDPRWQCVDSAGHSHAYSVVTEGNTYPTLEVHEYGAPDEDGWRPSYYRCVICKERVTPGMLPGPGYSVLAGPSDWDVRVSLDDGNMPDIGSTVTMVFSPHAGGGSWFGLAVISEAHMSSESSTALLRAAGQLGRMQG